MPDGVKGKGRVGGFTKNINLNTTIIRFDSNDVILRLS